MKLNAIGRAIDHLLFTGALRGGALLEVYHALIDYKQGILTAAEMQELIDGYDPDGWPLPIQEEDQVGEDW